MHSWNSRPYRTLRIRLLSGFPLRILRSLDCQNRHKLAKIFHFTKISADEWIPWWTLHVHAVLDLHLWHGSRLLDKFVCVIFIRCKVNKKQK